MFARIACILLFAVAAVGADKVSPLGTWEGESLCTVPDSPCRNEHVVYEIKPDSKGQGNVTVDAFKIVNGEKLFMGALNCTWTEAESVLACHYREDDDWSFKITGKEMKGTLHIKKERQLYRNISVTKK
jgi:hypothetical protein